MRIPKHLLITGGSGFVGQSYLEELTNQPELPEKVSVLYYKNHPKIPERLLKESQIDVYKRDLRLPIDLDLEPSHIINLAADGGTAAFTESAALDYKKIIENLATWIRQKKVENIFHASTGACYGYKYLNRVGQQIDSESKIIPEEIWNSRKKNLSDSRLYGEEILLEVANQNGFILNIGRLFTFSGKNILNHRNYAISQFIDMAKMGEINVLGNPLTSRSYLDERDMSHWIYKSLISDQASNLLQIGASEPVTIGELAEFIGAQFGVSPNFIQNNEKIESYIPDNVYTKDFLGVQEQYSWRESVLECVDYAKKERYEFRK
jgi:nucleoside-diphosphate-sugar epimerase